MLNINYDEFNYKMATVGYAVFENFLSIDKCNILKKIIEDELNYYKFSEHTERAYFDRHHLHDLICKHLDIIKLLEDEHLDKLIAQLLGEYWIMYAFTGSSCPPESTNYGGRIHVDCPRLIQNYDTNIGVMWVLDDFTHDNGATKILPASHHSEIIPNQDFFDKNSLKLVCPAGSLVIMNARVVHSTGFNNTDQWRHALTMNTCRPFMKQRMDWVRFVPENITKHLNQRAKRILGYDTRLPTNLQEFFLPEEDRLYKPNQG